MKKAIVIGATSGLGRALAELLAADGYRVGITGRRREYLEQLQQSKPGTFCISSFDITDTEKIPQALETLAGQLGGMDLLIISSGTGDENEALEFSIEKRTIDTNVAGFTCAADWAFNYFRKQGFGHLAAITSIAGLRGSRAAPAYNASKAYQIYYLEGVRQKATHLKLPVFITDIRPGLVDTAMAKGEGLFWVMPLDKAARQIYTAIHKKKHVVCVTKRWCLIAFILKIMPEFLYRRM